MIISIDFDDTFTSDPQAWSNVVNALVASGHEVVCISGRTDDEVNRDDLRHALPDSIERIYLCGSVGKKYYAEKNAIPVDVWIDDSPTRIVQAKQRFVPHRYVRRAR
jgi:hypothetical protein